MNTSVTQPQAVHELLGYYLQRKQQKTPAFSLRALAEKLEVSPSYVSGFLSGRKAVAAKHIPKLIKHLELDPLAAQRLQEALLRAKMPDLISTTPARNGEFKEAGFPSYQLLERWRDIALLDLISLKNFKADTQWIAKRLRISAEQAHESWQRLVKLKVIEYDGQRWQKNVRYLHFPTQRTDPRVRAYHLQHLDLARQELKTRVSEEDFRRRLATSATIAVNPAKLAEVQAIALRALQEITEVASDGECTELYALNLQFLPLTSPEGADE